MTCLSLTDRSVAIDAGTYRGFHAPYQNLCPYLGARVTISAVRFLLRKKGQRTWAVTVGRHRVVKGPVFIRFTGRGLHGILVRLRVP
jgi:hypothetical protein